MKPQKPLIFIVYSPVTRKYLTVRDKWTRFAEDAVEYLTYLWADRKAKELEASLDYELAVISAVSHFRPEGPPEP